MCSGVPPLSPRECVRVVVREARRARPREQLHVSARVMQVQHCAVRVQLLLDAPHRSHKAPGGASRRHGPPLHPGCACGQCCPRYAEHRAGGSRTRPRKFLPDAGHRVAATRRGPTTRGITTGHAAAATSGVAHGSPCPLPRTSLPRRACQSSASAQLQGPDACRRRPLQLNFTTSASVRAPSRYGSDRGTRCRPQLSIAVGHAAARAPR